MFYTRHALFQALGSETNSQTKEPDACKSVEITEEEVKQIKEQQLKQQAIAEKDLVSVAIFIMQQ